MAKTPKEPMYVEIRLQKLTKTHAYGLIAINEEGVSYRVGIGSRLHDNTFYKEQCVMVLAEDERAFLAETVLDYMAHAPEHMMDVMASSGTPTERGEIDRAEFRRAMTLEPTAVIRGLLKKLSIQKGDIIDV